MTDLEDFFYGDINIPTQEVSECEHDWIIYDGCYVCQECGQVDGRSILVVDSSKRNTRRHLYKRHTYFRDKLRLITSYKQSTSDDYIKMLGVLEKTEFETVQDLKRILKKNKYGLHHKYLYSIFNDIKQKQMVNLKQSDIESLENQFFDFERMFKQTYPNQKYIINYNIIIYYLLKKNGYPCYKNILLPRNYNKSVKKFIEVLKNY